MNKILLVGRISSPPVMFESKNLKIYAKASLAVNREYLKDITDFIPLTIFGNTAEYFKKYVNKGDLLSIEGSVQISNYKNDKGEIINSFSVIPSIVKHLEPKSIIMARLDDKSVKQNYSTEIFDIKTKTKIEQETFLEEEKDDNDIWELDL